MAEFTLEPDQPTADRPERRAPPRMVATGLAPTAEMPHARGKGKEECLGPMPPVKPVGSRCSWARRGQGLGWLSMCTRSPTR